MARTAQLIPDVTLAMAQAGEDALVYEIEIGLEARHAAIAAYTAMERVRIREDQRAALESQ